MERYYKAFGGVLGLTATLLYLGIAVLALVLAFRFLADFWHSLAEVLVFVFLIPALAISYRMAKVTKTG